MRIVLCVLACLLVGRARAQILISSGGDAYTTTTNHVVLSIGESFVETQTPGANALTYGFNQPIPGTIGILESGPIELEVFPNPTSNYVRVNTAFEGALEITIWSASGRLIEVQTIQPQDPILDFRMLPASMYILRMELEHKPYQVQIIKR